MPVTTDRKLRFPQVHELVDLDVGTTPLLQAIALDEMELVRALRTKDEEVFLDSDNLKDLRELLNDVRNSSVLILFQSRHVLERPWCLLEMYTAVMERVPIVALNCLGKGCT